MVNKSSTEELAPSGSSVLHINTSLDLALLRDVELKSLYTSISSELIRRSINVPNTLQPSSRKGGEVYVNKWYEWRNSITPRGVKWTWKKSSGKSWELTMVITGEDGNVTYYKRHGKTKRKTQQKLAEHAWYKYLNMGSSSYSSPEASEEE